MKGGRNDVDRILVVELWNIGDVVLLLPFLQQLRAIFPAARVSLAARSYAKDILAPTGLVDEFIDAELGWQHERVVWNPLAYPWRRLASVARHLRTRKFDLAFQCRPHVREYVLLWLSGARRRVGVYKRGWDQLLTDRVDVDVLRTQKKSTWLELLKPFGGTQRVAAGKLESSAADRERASMFLASHGVSTEDVVVGIHPGASVPGKRWPMERFAEVAERLVARAGVRVLIFVDPSGYGTELDRTYGRMIARVALPGMIALLERCDLLVCNDSGPMHIAAALGVTCVAVFSSGIDQVFAPLGEGHQLIVPAPDQPRQQALAGGTRRLPRYDVTGVSVGRVMDAIDRVLG